MAARHTLIRVRSARIDEHREGVVGALQLTPLVGTLVVFLLAPLVIFFIYSVWRLRSYQIVSEWNLDNYRAALESDIYRRLLWNTFRIAGLTALLTVTIAYVFAHALRFHLQRVQNQLVLLVLVAAFSGYLVRIYAWRTILGERGFVNTVLHDLGLTDRPLDFLLFNRFAAILVLSNFLLPVAVLTVYAALQNIRDSEIEAARDLGAGMFTTLRRVTLPLAWPGIYAALALCFIFAAGDYLTPMLVGGTSGTMVGRTIADAFNAQFDWPSGAALSFLTLAIVLLVLAVVRVVGNRVFR
jgi:spermidine/putrescine transport system permease protein